MQIISLFSGIGGFEIAAEWMGWDNIVSCEINPFGRKNLEYHFPNSYHHDDVHTLNYDTIKEKSRWNPSADTIVCGGFPCQPYSTAGKRFGKEDERHLWPEMLRVIREVKPRWVVGENVRGLVSWSDGLVFEEVCADLETEGYEVQPFILPAASINAPHKRARVWFVAFADTKCLRRENGLHGGEKDGVWQADKSGNPHTKHIGGWENFPTQPPVCGGDDGLPCELDGISFSKWRAESIKAYGNAIVPQVALQIFKAIQVYEDEQK